MHIIIETDEIDQYETEVRQILEVLGHPEALVTNTARFYEFTIDPFYGEDEDEIARIRDDNAVLMEEIGALCGCIIEEGDLILDAAKLLRANM
jgi:hypothetical protein